MELKDVNLGAGKIQKAYIGTTLVIGAEEPPTTWGRAIIDYATFSEQGLAEGTVTKNADGDFTFTPPVGVTEFQVCAVGGGGGGARSGYTGNVENGGGGYAGEYLATVGEITSPLSMSIGTGAIVQGTLHASGLSGNPTIVGGTELLGGSGGINNSSSYGGDGGEFTSPCGTYRDGYLYAGSGFDGIFYGGQASALGHGGGGSNNPTLDGVAGSGGGGTASGAHLPGAGGDGRVVIYWEIV